MRKVAIAHNRNPKLRIAIVGAGLAGLTAARELFRCGYTAIDLYEASDRIGGRTYSIPLNTPETDSYTVFEMGAMRIPYFTAPGSGNSVMDYFRELVYMPAAKYNPNQPGFFGGLGMTEEESNLFYTIGAGDGTWGAFYDISCLYPIRTLLFGFGTNHQLIRTERSQRKNR